MQKLYSGHPAFLTYGTGDDIDSANSQQLFLPGFLSDLFLCYDFAGSEELTALRDVVFAVSVCQQAEVTYTHITRG